MVSSERLRHAIRAANLTTEEFADLVGVNPKTIGRWVTGVNVPQRHNQIRVARALNLTVPDLWPEEPPPTVKEPGPNTQEPVVVPAAACEVTGTWGSVTNTPSPFALIATGTGPINVLILAPHPSLLQALNTQAKRGREVRVLLASPDTALPAGAHPSVQVRAGTGPYPYQLIHSGQQMQLVIRLQPEPGPVLLTLARIEQDGLFDRITQHYEALWDNATHGKTRTPPRAPVSDGTGPASGRQASGRQGSTGQGGSDDRENGPERSSPMEPSDPREQPSNTRPRLWPRRPS